MLSAALPLIHKRLVPVTPCSVQRDARVPRTVPPRLKVANSLGSDAVGCLASNATGYQGIEVATEIRKWFRAVLQVRTLRAGVTM